MGETRKGAKKQRRKVFKVGVSWGVVAGADFVVFQQDGV